MIEIFDDLDTFLITKYGYPLTEHSYDLMPDELVDMIYFEVYGKPALRKDRRPSIQHDIRFYTTSLTGNISWSELWTKSPGIWNIIRKYHSDSK